MCGDGVSWRNGGGWRKRIVTSWNWLSAVVAGYLGNVLSARHAAAAL